MLFLFLFILLHYLEFYTPDAFSFIYLQVELALTCSMAWYYIGSVRGKSLFCLLTLYSWYIAMTDFFLPASNLQFFVESLIFSILYTTICMKSYNFKSDDINENNVCLAFYKPKKFKQIFYSLFGYPCASFSLILGKDIIQARYENYYMQKYKYDKKHIEKNYLIIDTGAPVKSIDKEKVKDVLKQPVRQNKTCMLRLNCLRNFRHILNGVKGYEYKGDILPSIYLRRIIKNAGKR